MPSDASRRGGSRDPHLDLTGALHDVSNALTVLLGWVAEARAEGATEEATRYALRIIEQRARGARDLARRAIGAEVESAEEEELVGTALGDVMDVLAVEASSAGVRLVAEGEPGQASVPAASDLGQVLTNLIMNAIGHSPNGGAVRVRLSLADHAVAIDVEDEGPGVPEARRASIFRGDSTRKGGAGVGLRHARALTRAQGGDLVLAGSRSASGACFHLTWPRAGLLPPPPLSSPKLRTLEGRRVLVVEDDAHVTQLLETTLTARGAEVIVARTALDLARLVTGRYDSALIDLSPILGHEAGALRALRAASPGVRIVLMTGSADGIPASLVGENLRLVRKPFEIGELVTALTESRA